MRPRPAVVTGLLAFFLASGLVLSAGSWAYRILAIALITPVAVSAYSRQDLVTYAKLALAVAFTSSQPVGFFFVLLTAALWRDRVILTQRSELRPIYLLLLYGLGVSLINQLVEINLLAYPFFVASFFLPVMYFVLFRDPQVVARADEVVDFLFVLTAIITPVILLQTTLHWGQSPDWRTGGTLHAHMAGVLIGTTFMVALGRCLARGVGWRELTRLERFHVVGALPVVFLVDAKYVLVLLLGALTLMTFVWLVAKRSRVIPVAAAAVLGGSIAANWEALARAPLPLSAAVVGTEGLSATVLLDGFRLTPRGQVLEATTGLPDSDPRIFWLGSGPGTFLSRASNSRAYDTMQKSVYDQLAGQQEVESKLPGFIPPFTSWVTRRYALHVIHWSTFEAETWMTGLMRWVSSLTSFFWEFGVIGFATLMAFYVRLFARGVRVASSAVGLREAHAYSLAGLTAFYVGVAFFDLWMEMPQFALLHWGVLGLLAGAVLPGPDPEGSR